MSGTTSGDTFQGVSNCYVFKSRLQEFAQKVGLPTPTYETIKEGPSHEPTFKSTVIVNDVRYDSLPGFFNRKAAEQSAAEIALLALSRSGNAAAFISQPTHETGLCKNLLQEYAQKMNHAIPLYECKRDDTCGRIPMFSCTVEIGGMKYIGGAAKTKKEAEIKAARTAMLAIQATSSGSHLDGQSNYTVLPIKKKLPDSGTPAKAPAASAAAALKTRKRQFKKKPRKNNMNGVNGGRNRYVKNTSQMQVRVCDQSLAAGLGDANADVDTRVNANVDAHINANGNGDGNGDGNVDAHINANGNADVNVNVNGDGSVNGMDAAYDPCSNRGGDGDGDGDGDNSRSLSYDANLLQTWIN